MGSRKAQNSARIIAALTLLATFMGIVYNSTEVGRLLFGFEGRTPKDESEKAIQYSRFDPHVLKDAPWAKKSWNAVGGGSQTLSYQSRRDAAIVSVDGLPTGPVELHLTEISADGRTYRGLAESAEHGGIICWNAMLHRQANNRLRIEIQSTNPASPKIDIEFQSGGS